MYRGKFGWEKNERYKRRRNVECNGGKEEERGIRGRKKKERKGWRQKVVSSYGRIYERGKVKKKILRETQGCGCTLHGKVIK